MIGRLFPYETLTNLQEVLVDLKEKVEETVDDGILLNRMADTQDALYELDSTSKPGDFMFQLSEEEVETLPP